MIAAFRLLDFNQLDATTGRWLTVAMPMVQSQRLKSAAAAATYLSAFRLTELASTFTPVVAKPVDVAVIATSLTVTGPVSIKSNTARGVQLARAVDLALAGVSGAAIRHTLNGGRETVLATTKADPRARGWERITSGNACEFCRNLAGIVFPDDRQFECHDSCQCSNEPVYS